MIARRAIQMVVGGSVGLLGTWPNAAEACAVCFGNPEAPMNQGMAWGIMTLLFVIASVLGGIVAVTVFLARRSALISAGAMEEGGESVESSADAEDPWSVPFAKEMDPEWMREPESENELQPAGK